MYGLGGRAPSGYLVESDGQPGAPFRSFDPLAADWALRLPPGVGPMNGSAVVHLDGHSGANFPILRDWLLAVDWSRKGLRVEPLSPIPSPEWDLLLSTGRLDALTPGEAAQLTREKWFDAVLGLAGAYAIYAQADWPDLRIVTDNLRRIATPGVDLDLLDIVEHRRGNKPLTIDDTKRLKILAEGRPVPLLRWGVPLALELLAAAALDASVWSSDLARIQATLSPISVWTAWTTPRPTDHQPG
jgi:hypothetical protein